MIYLEFKRRLALDVSLDTRFKVLLTLGYAANIGHKSLHEVTAAGAEPLDLATTFAVDGDRMALRAQPVSWPASTITADGYVVFLPDYADLLMEHITFHRMRSSDGGAFDLSFGDYLLRL